MTRAQEVSRAATASRGWARSACGGCQVWGILNVTPDSFSDGGRFAEADSAAEEGHRMWRAGADVVDVGGESTRPAGAAYGAGAARVDAAEELRRVLPVVERLVAAGVRVSVDTTKGEVAREVLAIGAHVINDVSGGSDPSLLRAVAEADAELVLMHNRGRGECEGDNARYADVVKDALDEVLGCVERAERAGVSPTRLWIDPGLGFAKKPEDSARILSRLSPWVQSGYRVLVGASRKSFLGRLCQGPAVEAPAERLPGSLAAACMAASLGAAAVRVHDVPETLQALGVLSALWREAAG